MESKGLQIKPIWLSPLSMATSLGLGLGATLGFGASPGMAAEQVNIRFGPIQQPVSVSGLEAFVATNTLPPELEPYAYFLNSNQQQLLQQSLILNPDLSPTGLQDMFQAPMGQRLAQLLARVVPEATPAQIQTAMLTASQQPRGLNLINFVRALPTQTVTVDVPAILAIRKQLERDYRKSQAFGQQLADALFVRSEQSFQANLNPAALGGQQPQERVLQLNDRQRQRQIDLKIYTGNPTADTPLVVMFHGLGGNRNALAYLARHLSSHGLTVVTLQHPDRTALNRNANQVTLGGGLFMPPQDFIERPKDVSFALDQLARLNQRPGALRGKLNTHRVTLIGQSLGGTTALTLAGAELNIDSLRTSCQAITPVGRSLGDWALCNATALPNPLVRLVDRRVTQAVLINPVVGDLFGAQGLRWVRASTLVVSSSGDSISPAIGNHLRPFQQLPEPKYLVTAIGATHLSTNDVDNLTRTGRVRIINERLGQDNQPFQTLIRGSVLAFIQQQTPNAQRYQPFLSAGYAQSLSTPAMPLRFSTQLPSSIVNRLQDLELGQSGQPLSQGKQTPTVPQSRRAVFFGRNRIN
jgi:predicted dienelactone hydrolase